MATQTWWYRSFHRNLLEVRWFPQGVRSGDFPRLKKWVRDDKMLVLTVDVPSTLHLRSYGRSSPTEKRIYLEATEADFERHLTARYLR